jgi:hypothetical protein
MLLMPTVCSKPEEQTCFPSRIVMLSFVQHLQAIKVKVGFNNLQKLWDDLMANGQNVDP